MRRLFLFCLLFHFETPVWAAASCKGATEPAHPQISLIFSRNSRFVIEQNKIKKLLAAAIAPEKFDFAKAIPVRDPHFTNTARQAIKLLKSTREQQANSELWTATFENMVSLVKKALADRRELSYEEHLIVFMLYSLLQNHNEKTYTHYNIQPKERAAWVEHDLKGLEKLSALNFSAVRSLTLSEATDFYFRKAHSILRKNGGIMTSFEGLGIDDIALTVGEPLHVMEAPAHSVTVHGTPHRSSEVAKHDLDHAEQKNYEHEFTVKFKQWLKQFKSQNPIPYEQELKTLILFTLGREMFTTLNQRGMETHLSNSRRLSELSHKIFRTSQEYLDGQNSAFFNKNETAWKQEQILQYLKELSQSFDGHFPNQEKQNRPTFDDTPSYRF